MIQNQNFDEKSLLDFTYFKIETEYSFHLFFKRRNSSMTKKMFCWIQKNLGAPVLLALLIFFPAYLDSPTTSNDLKLHYRWSISLILIYISFMYGKLYLFAKKNYEGTNKKRFLILIIVWEIILLISYFWAFSHI